MLKGPDREDALARHQAFYLKFAEEAEPLLRSHDAAAAYKRLEADDDNLRAAMSRAAESEEGLRIAGALWRYWLPRGQAAEGQQWLLKALDANPEAPIEYRVRALNGLGVLTPRLGRVKEAHRILEQSVYMARRLGNPWEPSHGFSNL